MPGSTVARVALSRDALATILSTCDFFQGLGAKSKEALADISIPRTSAKRQILFVEGEKGSSLYLCIHGNVQLHKSTTDGRDVVIRVIGPGEMFGEVVLFEEDRYPVTAIMLTKGLIVMIPKSQFNSLLAAEDFRRDFIAMLMRKQRYLAGRIRYFSIRDVGERLRLFLRDQFGARPAIVCTLSKKDVAGAIGTTPETLSRELLRLGKTGALRWKGSRIAVGSSFWGG